MIFTSGVFLVFILIVLPLYLTLSHRLQNILLLVASYVFYGWWNWRLLSLLLFSTLLDYVIGLALVSARMQRHRRQLLTTSICIQFGLLGIFKYYDFFAASFASAALSVGWHVNPHYLNLVLPVGISFYTFHTLSYTVDIYRGKFTPTKDFIAFALFISFFPQLVAGPIARASHLLPQMIRPRRVTMTDWYEGSYLFYWGLFKKVAVADSLGILVDRAFANPQALSFPSALIAAYAFAWQIYCDFSGYTDMARGCARWFGIDLMVNFNVPYLANNPSDFWRRWHISLSSMLRDYLYIPLGGSRGGTARTHFNLMATMLLGGLWHGANWTFVIWGFYQGVLLIGYRVLVPDLDTLAVPSWKRVLHVVIFFHLLCIGWLVFRASSVAELLSVLTAFTRPGSIPLGSAARLMLAAPVLLVESSIYFQCDQLAFLRLPTPVRVAVYVGIYTALIGVGHWGGAQFIYFQF